MPRSKRRDSNIGSRGEPEQTRLAILQAAMREFGSEGLAGARMDSIAKSAGVNKALLHYYFRDKETLYGAALDVVFSRMAGQMKEVLERDLPPREKIMAYAGAHFDFIASAAAYPALVQREMMRGGKSPHVRRIATRYLIPTQKRAVAALQAGIASGDFRKVDPLHFVLSIVAMNVFYFASAPLLAMVMGDDPLRPRRMAQRRSAVLDVISAALSVDRPVNHSHIHRSRKGRQ